MARPRTNTRNEIIDAAMRRFVDQGYDGTSLREIAEDLGLTKAALYYHFRTKDEIVAAAFEAHVRRLDELADWFESEEAVEGPQGGVGSTGADAARADALFDRLEEMFDGESGLVMRFAQVNQAVVAREGLEDRNAHTVLRLMGLLADGADGIEDRMRIVLALGAIMMTTIDQDTLELGGTTAQRRSAARRVARELLSRGFG